MESSLEKKQRVNLLMDCYSDLLTEKQQTYLEYYYQTGQFAEFKNMIREMQGKQVVLSKDKQDLLNFWQGKEVMA